MRKIRLGCDLDGVLFDFNTRFCRLLEEELRVTMPLVTQEWPTQWEYPTVEGYITKEQDRAIWKRICSGAIPGFWDSLPWYEWTREMRGIILTKTEECYFITSRCGPNRLAESTRALKELFYAMPVPVIPVDNHERKLPIINALNLTHYIDDRWDTMALAGLRCLNAKLALWDQPWNRHDEIPGVTRLKTMEEFRQWLS